jgi:hypothetical protein
MAIAAANSTEIGNRQLILVQVDKKARKSLGAAGAELATHEAKHRLCKEIYTKYGETASEGVEKKMSIYPKLRVRYSREGLTYIHGNVGVRRLVKSISCAGQPGSHM